MNLLCPHCQKMVQVQDQFAGKPMQCPLCGKAFTAPILPQSMGVTSSVPASPPLPAPTPTEEPPVYSFVPEPRRQPEPASRSALPISPPTPAPEQDRGENSPWGSPTPAAPASAIPPPTGYARVTTIWISPRAQPWIALAALILVFLLTFFPWVGMYPGGLGVYSQTAWQAAFGAHWSDPVFWKKVMEPKGDSPAPGVSLFTLVFLISFVPAIVLAVAMHILPHTQVKLPPVLQKLWPFRSGLLGGLTVLAIFFLLMQLAFGFSLEDKFEEGIRKTYEAPHQAAVTEEENRIVLLKEGLEMDKFNLQRTIWLWLVVLLLIVALKAQGLDFWLERRGKEKPLPRIDFSR